MNQLEEDEKLARLLQAQLNGENVQNEKPSQNIEKQITEDLEYAKQLEGEKGGEPQDEEKKKQFDLDVLVALELQEQLYQEELLKPPTPPASYTLPSFSTNSHHSLFHHQKPDVNRAPPTPECIKRITSDIKEIIQSKNRYIFVVPDEEDITHVQALIVGPPDTPYAHGFFHFDLIFPHDYPWQPPKVQLITTDSGRVRFNPNLYANGKVCLSILGTWSGPGWTQVQTMLSTLLSIQSLMNSKPYHNEPGFEQERKVGDIENYNNCIIHETLRVAVCGMLENPTCGKLFEEEMQSIFLERYDEYIGICEKMKGDFEGKVMEDPFGEKRGIYCFKKISDRLKIIKEAILNKEQSKEENLETLETIKTFEKEEIYPQESQSNESYNPDELSSHLIDFSNVHIPEPIQMNIEQKESSDESVDESSLEMAKKLQQQLIVQTDVIDTCQIENDLEFAKKLQEEEYSDLGYDNPKFKASYTEEYNENPYLHQTSYKREYSPHSKRFHQPIKPPPLSELSKEDEPMKDQDYDPDIVCLICHQSPKEYIILPACQQPHIYCMACATKMIKQGNPKNRYGYGYSRFSSAHKRATNGIGQPIKCVLCSAVSTLDPDAGLNYLRRKKRKVEEQITGRCSIHNEDFCLFCFDDYELICHLCAGHQRHNTEPFCDAQEKVERQIDEKTKLLSNKRKKLEDFIQSIRSQQSDIQQSCQTTQKEMKEKIKELRNLLDEKEKELCDSIQRLADTKSRTIDGHLKRAQDRISEIDKTLLLKEEIDCLKSQPIQYLKKVEIAEEQIRHTCMPSTDLEIKPYWFQLPPVNIRPLEQSIKGLKYKEKFYSVGNSFVINEDEVAFEDEYIEY